MNTRLVALLLALCLALGLCACGGPDHSQPSPEPDPSASPELVEPEPSDTPTVEPSDEPSGEPVLQPTEGIPEDVGTGPIQTPPVDEISSATEGHHEEEPAKEFNAADIYAMWLTTSSQFPAPTASFVDMGDYVDAFYTTLDLDDVDSFVFYQPDMSGALQEVFIAKAKSGKVSSVKSAVQDRLDGIKEEAEFYPGTAEYVPGAKVETTGDWVVLCVAPDADRLVKLVKDSAK